MNGKEVAGMLGDIGDSNQAAGAAGTLREWMMSTGWEPWLLFVLAAGVSIAVALIGHYLLVAGLTRLTRRIASGVGELTILRLSQPVRWLMVILAIFFVMNDLFVLSSFGRLVQHLLTLVLIVLVSWLLIRTVEVFSATVGLRLNVDVKDSTKAREIQTQLSVLRRVFIVGIVIVASGTMLMTFPGIRQLGTTILASAGIVGIIVGFAAQRTLGMVLAGLQIAFTQPIRIDDVVVVEGEWGRIEEITLTYVIVKTWNLRRLIIPITYFIEKPFQNWTRISADLVGAVILKVGYSVPIDAIRAELRRILDASQLWDGKVGTVQVTDVSEATVEVRILVSATDASNAWDLRCQVRERLVEFIRNSYPKSLPGLRAEMAGQ
jgi:small-conductance mechanosensitive channel